jgi:hypothetical protein
MKALPYSACYCPGIGPGTGPSTWQASSLRAARRAALPSFLSFRFLYLELPIVQVVAHLYAWLIPRLTEFVIVLINSLYSVTTYSGILSCWTVSLVRSWRPHVRQQRSLQEPRFSPGSPDSAPGEPERRLWIRGWPPTFLTGIYMGSLALSIRLINSYSSYMRSKTPICST